MSVPRLLILAAAMATTVAARGDELTEAFDRGFDEGYARGKAEAITVFGQQASSTAYRGIVVSGTNFQTTIEKSGTPGMQDAKISLDSSIAIIPNDVLPEIRQKLGADFLNDKNILLNNVQPF